MGGREGRRGEVRWEEEGGGKASQSIRFLRVHESYILVYTTTNTSPYIPRPSSPISSSNGESPCSSPTSSKVSSSHLLDPPSSSFHPPSSPFPSPPSVPSTLPNEGEYARSGSVGVGEEGGLTLKRLSRGEGKLERPFSRFPRSPAKMRLLVHSLVSLPAFDLPRLLPFSLPLSCRRVQS